MVERTAREQQLDKAVAERTKLDEQATELLRRIKAGDPDSVRLVQQRKGIGRAIKGFDQSSEFLSRKLLCCCRLFHSGSG